MLLLLYVLQTFFLLSLVGKYIVVLEYEFYREESQLLTIPDLLSSHLLSLLEKSYSGIPVVAK